MKLAIIIFSLFSILSALTLRYAIPTGNVYLQADLKCVSLLCALCAIMIPVFILHRKKVK